MPLADPIAGVLITVAIVYVLAGTVRDLFYRMMDAVDPAIVSEVTDAAAAVPGVLAVHDVAARWVGRELWVVMHIDCDPQSTLREAHDVVERVTHAVSHEVTVGRLDVHMDPGTEHHHHQADPEHGSGRSHSETRVERHGHS